MSYVYIENLGCAKNQVDAEVMGARLEDAGWVWTDEVDRADLIVVNTCGFIEPAQQESIDTALALLQSHHDTPIALAGCMAQRFAEDLAKGMPEIAGIFGNRAPHRITEFVDRLFDPSRDSRSAPVVWVPDGTADLTESPRRRLLSRPGSAFMKIAEGCDHNCSFCAIPSIRGRLRMRPADEIVSEFRRLRSAGVREFNLVAQDLAAWRNRDDRGEGFSQLVRMLLDEPGEFWLRPLYLYPDTFPRELPAIAREDPRLLPYFDLSFQHSVPHVLRRMGRPGTPERYLNLIEEIRAVLPDGALRSSFIVGFPGESEADVDDLIGFLEAARLEWVGVFDFSSQEGTPAAALTDQVPPKVITERRRRVEAAQETIVSERLARFVGRELPVIVEDRIQGTDMVLGRSPLQAPDVDGLVVVHEAPAEIDPGVFVSVEVTGVTGVDLQATFRRLRG